jgi:hypothetical protein
MVAIRWIKHPCGQQANRAVRQATEYVFTMAIAFATTHGQRLAVEWMPAIGDCDALKLMSIM